MTTRTMATRNAYLDDLRQYQEALAKATNELDKPTLVLAAEIVALYENHEVLGEPFDRRWQDELPGVELGKKGPRDPDSFSRFCKWAAAKTGLKKTHLSQLRRADRLAAYLDARAQIRPTGEFALRPLWWFVKEDKEVEIPKVWKAATQLAGGKVPSNPDVKKALSDWKKTNLPKGAGEKLPKGIRRKIKKEEEVLRGLLIDAPSIVAPMLRHVLDEYEAKPNPLAGVS